MVNMIRYLEEKDIDNCLALMELVKDDFAGYKKDEFIQAMYNIIIQCKTENTTENRANLHAARRLTGQKGGAL